MSEIGALPPGPPAPPDGSTGPRELLATLGRVLWFPTLFVVGFVVFYFVPFHTAAPHSVPVAVVGEQASAQIGAAFDRAAPGSFAVTAAPDVEAARQEVLARDADAALDLGAGGPGPATLYVAGANGRSLTPVLETSLAPVVPPGSAPLQVVDVAPLRAADSTGASFFYLALIFNLVSYITVMFLIQAPGLGRRRSLVILSAVGAVVSVGVWLVAWPFGVLPVEAWVIPLSFLLTQAVGWTAFGLVPLVGRWLPGVLLFLFVLVSIPSSSGAVPVHLVPEFYQLFQHVMPLGSYVDAARGVLFFGGTAVTSSIFVLLAWLLLGVGLVARGARRDRHDEARSEAAERRADVTAVGTADEDGGAAEGTGSPGRVVPAGGVVISGTVVDHTGRAVTGGTVTATSAEGRPLGRVPIDAEGDFAQLVTIEDGATVVVTAFGGDAGVGALPLRVVDGHAPPARVRLTDALHTKVSGDRIESASAVAAGALGGAV